MHRGYLDPHLGVTECARVGFRVFLEDSGPGTALLGLLVQLRANRLSQGSGKVLRKGPRVGPGAKKTRAQLNFAFSYR